MRTSLAYVRLLAAQLAIGAAAIFARYALLGAGPLAVSALRLSLAALVALAFVRRFAALSIKRERSFAAAGAALAVHFAAWIASLEYTSVALSTLLVTTTPIWTELYDTVHERRPPTRAFVIALALGLVGVAAVALQSATKPPPIAGNAALGNALALLGSIAIGAYLLIVRNAGNAPGEPRLATQQIVARTYGWSALTLIAAATLARQAPPAAADTAAWGGILAMALVSQGLGHTALNAALRNFSPSVVALSTLLEPLVATLLAAALFHELLSAQALAGGALVLAAVSVTLWDARTATLGAAVRPARSRSKEEDRPSPR